MSWAELLELGRKVGQYVLGHIASDVAFLLVGFVVLFVFRWHRIKRVEKQLSERLTGSWRIAVPNVESSHSFGHYLYIYLMLLALVVIVLLAVCDVAFDLNLLK